MSDMILGIHSNVSGDEAGFTSGHAWISIRRGGKTTVYGLWPDAHPKTLDNGDKSDIRVGMESRSRPKASRYYKLSDAQSKHFNALMRANVGWTYTNTCSAWASDIVESVIGEDVDSDDYFGFETPRELGKSSEELEKKDPTSILSPKKLTKNPASSTQTSGK
ncbi:hypothetical protein [Motiliproteus sp. MSK22-1]|uniref:hypothetical protein n=1 Tax=Motiliproteus sp. MSK22-1 TaxID=1897630 RepID=UPI000978A396|nr:hypothetical protein [Motiliproteus sp. MSK22-1]OMH29104.1 hypothetical protein BGP75_20335 [Motiliproteus sp. MSK22-1]